MKKENPPPSLGKLPKQRKPKLSKFERQMQRYGEWQALLEQAVMFERALTNPQRVSGASKLRVVVTGNPRKASIHVLANFGVERKRIRFVIDIRDGDMDGWWKPFLECEWHPTTD